MSESQFKVTTKPGYLKIEADGANTYVLDESLMFANQGDQTFITYTRESFLAQLVVMIRMGFLSATELADVAAGTDINEIQETYLQ